MKRLMLLSCMLFLFNSNSWAWSFSLFGNYDDCVLDRVEAGMGGAVVGAIKASCRSKYPLKKVKTIVKKFNLPVKSEPLVKRKECTYETVGRSYIHRLGDRLRVSRSGDGSVYLINETDNTFNNALIDLYLINESRAIRSGVTGPYNSTLLLVPSNKARSSSYFNSVIQSAEKLVCK